MKPELIWSSKTGCEIIKRVTGRFVLIWKGKAVYANFPSFGAAYRYYQDEFFIV